MDQDRVIAASATREDELIEALLHMMGYVGAPLIRDAMLVATKTFAEIRAEG